MAESPLYGAAAAVVQLEWLPGDADFMDALHTLGYRSPTWDADFIEGLHTPGNRSPTGIEA